VAEPASGVPGAKMLLFDDSGHGFLFQDAAGFVRDVETFIGWKARKLKDASNPASSKPSRSRGDAEQGGSV
jgi:hypothetical protein